MVKENKITPNEHQQIAINSTEGKYLVLAGPGTGKTFTIIERIKHMILDKNVEPEKILCLTYTDAAVNEMKTRLDKELNERAVGVNVFTYHSFCCEVIEKFKDQLELPDNYKVIPFSISRAFVKECIDEIQPKAYRTDKNDPYYYIKDILNGIDEIKKNNLTKKEYFYNLINNDDWEPLLANYNYELEEKQKSKKTIAKKLLSDIESQRKKIDKAKELWLFYEKYTEKMEKLHYLDFNDMINTVLTKFEKDTAFLSKVANQYEYILVDEYQDTNYSQNAIILNLAQSLDSQNIFVVGDDDQTIFSFQGAKLNTMENFLNTFRETKVICLKENMRSTQTILDTAREFILKDSNRLENNPNFKNYNIDKKLEAKNKDVISKDKKVTLTTYNDIMQENNTIVDEIEALINSEDCPKDKDGNKKYSEIAVLSRRNQDLRELAELFEARNIPYELKDGIDIFSIHAVIVLFSYMQMLINPELYAHRIIQILLAKPFSINPKDYQKIISNISRYKNPIEVIRYVLEHNNEADDEDKLIEENKLKNFIDTYDYLNNYKNCESIKNTVLEIGAKTGIFRYYLNFDINKTKNIAGLKKLVEEASEYSSIYNTCLLEDFVEYLNIIINDEIEILTDKAPVSFNAVQLSTYYSSKGKEYEYVYMPCLINWRWERNTKFSLKPIIPLSPSEYKDEDELKELKASDAKKILFVGMTRAKHSLKLSYNQSGSNKLTTHFESIINIFERIQADEYDENSYWNEAKKVFIKRDYDYKKDFNQILLEKVNSIPHYSASSINEYLSCPRKFMYEKLLKWDVKSGNADAAHFGTAIHYACEQIVENAIDNKVYLEKEEFLNLFEKKLTSLPISCYEQKEILLGRGRNALDKFYSQFVGLPVSCYVDKEHKFTDESLGFKFEGYIDRIDKNSDGTYSIYDYKTGKAKTGKEICIDGNHEDYYNQMALYKYFYEKLYNCKVTETTFIFPEQFEKNYHLELTEQEVNDVVEKVKQAVEDIKSLKFEPSYKEDTCKYCQYKDYCNSNIV